MKTLKGLALKMLFSQSAFGVPPQRISEGFIRMLSLNSKSNILENDGLLPLMRVDAEWLILLLSLTEIQL